MLDKLLFLIVKFLRVLNGHFRLRSTGERVEIIHVMRDNEQTLCLVEGQAAARFIVREQELEPELLHIGTTALLCSGLALSGIIVGLSLGH